VRTHRRSTPSMTNRRHRPPPCSSASVFETGKNDLKFNQEKQSSNILSELNNQLVGIVSMLF
jgi:hypothetical protein